MSGDCVVDASVGIKLFLLEALTDRADALFSRAIEDPSLALYVPDLFYIECTNILYKYVRWHGHAAEDAERDLGNLLRLPLNSVSTYELAADAMALAVDHRISAYDAAYVALGVRLGLPVVTADEALVRRLAGSGLDMRWLGEWPQGSPVGDEQRLAPSQTQWQDMGPVVGHEARAALKICDACQIAHKGKAAELFHPMTPCA
jgi:predicted nucleic acid-binding protein